MITSEARNTPAKTARTLSLPIQALLADIDKLSGIADIISAIEASMGAFVGTAPYLFLLDSPSKKRKNPITSSPMSVGDRSSHQPDLPTSCNLRIVTVVNEKKKSSCRKTIRYSSGPIIRVVNNPLPTDAAKLAKAPV